MRKPIEVLATLIGSQNADVRLDISSLIQSERIATVFLELKVCLSICETCVNYNYECTSCYSSPQLRYLAGFRCICFDGYYSQVNELQYSSVDSVPTPTRPNLQCQKCLNFCLVCTSATDC